MLFSEFFSRSRNILQADGVTLRPPRPSDYDAWAALRDESRAALTPWEPEWTADELTRTAYRRRLRFYAHHRRHGTGHAFFIFRNGALVGGVNLFNIESAAPRSAAIGYWIGAPYQRQGLATAALSAVLPFAFERLNLARVEAACLPENEASQRLLARAGFQPQGLVKDYLQINGALRDHLLFAMAKSVASR